MRWDFGYDEGALFEGALSTNSITAGIMELRKKSKQRSATCALKAIMSIQ